MPSETPIIAGILRFLNLLPETYAWRNNNQPIFDRNRNIFRRRNTVRGLPDILGWHKGIMLGIEVKSKTCRVSPEQQIFIDRLNKDGGIGIIARSVDDVIINLRTRGYSIDLL